MLKRTLAITCTLLGCTALFCFYVSASALTLKNTGTDNISASVNSYDVGNSDYITIQSNYKQTWSQTDDRGFILSIIEDGYLRTYYVKSDDSFYFQNDNLYYESTSQQNVPLKAENNQSPGATSHITVDNFSEKDVSVGISTWIGGAGESPLDIMNREIATIAYDIKPNDLFSCLRDIDSRGYLLYVKFSGNNSTYVYYLPSSQKQVAIRAFNDLTIDGQKLNLIYFY